VTEVRYCLNRCTRLTDSGDRIRVQTEPPSQMCNRCEDKLRQWLQDIPDKYALLPLFVEHGTAEPDPDYRRAKRTDAPAPMRLEVVDLLDQRLGRKWLGSLGAEAARIELDGRLHAVPPVVHGLGAAAADPAHGQERHGVQAGVGHRCGRMAGPPWRPRSPSAS